jgi:hypothetical protein
MSFQDSWAVICPSISDRGPCYGFFSEDVSPWVNFSARFTQAGPGIALEYRSNIMESIEKSWRIKLQKSQGKTFIGTTIWL